MKNIKKGDFGYIKKQRMIEIIKTLFTLSVSVGVYYLGLYATKTNQNLLTFVAVLGCLPMAKFAVNAVMFSKAKSCSKELFDEINNKGLSPLFYDLFFTTMNKNFSVSVLEYKRNSLIMLSEDSSIDVKAAEEHIETVLKNIKIENVTVKLFTDKDKFIDRLIELKNLEEDNKDITELKENILSVSI